MENVEVYSTIVAAVAIAELVDQAAATIPESKEAVKVQALSAALVDHLRRVLSDIKESL